MTITRMFAAPVVWLSAAGLLLPATSSTARAQQDDDPNIDRAVVAPWYSPQPRPSNEINVITGSDGFDNFDLGVDFAEPHMSSHPSNPLWYFNAYNVTSNLGANSHNTINGHDWTTTNPTWPTIMRGDPVTAYDSLGNLYFEQMYGSPNILGTMIARSTDNGQSWVSVVTGNTGNDKNWIACDQTMGPYANYIYATMTPGNFVRSTDLGASFQITATMSNSLPGNMVAVGPNVLNGNNIPGGCVYVVTGTGSSFSATWTFYRSTNGGASFQTMSTQNFANYVGTNVNGRNSIENFRTRPYPFITADNSYGPYRGRLYLVYSSNVPAGDGNKPDIFCRYSTDQGVSWSSPATINDDPGSTSNHQWHPSIWCDKTTGRLYVKWLDTRNTPTSDSAEVFASYSDNGGQVFAQNQRISNRKFKIDCLGCGGGGTPKYLGDYDAITSNAQGAMLSWTDFRNSNFLSMTAYFPDFAMLASPAVDTLSNTDSIDIVVKIPAVKLYTHPVTFTAEVAPAGSFTLSFPGGNTLATFPDSLILRVKTVAATNGNYTVSVTGRGPNGTPVHKRNVSLLVASPFVALQQPNGGEQLFARQSYQILWGKFNVDSVKIEYSTDNGSSWVLVSSGTQGVPSQVIHPKDRLRALERGSGDSPAVGGYTWVVPNTPSTTCLVRVSDKTNSSIFDVSDAPFTILPTPAAQWAPRTTSVGNDLFAVSVVDTLRAWVGGDSGRVMRTLNGGASWISSVNLTDPVTSIWAVDVNRVLAVTNAPGNARIRRTLTGGISWATVYQNTDPNAYIDAITMFDINNGYAVADPIGGQWTLLRTTDGGATWTNAGSLPAAGSEVGWNNSMSWIGTTNGWFGTDNSRIYYTTNGGTNWNSAATPFVNSYAVSFATQALGMATGTGTARSTNGGAGWASTPTAPPGNPFASAAVNVNPSRWYFVTGSSIYKTADQGTTFQSDYAGGTPYNHIDMKIVNIGGNDWVTGYAVGDGGVVTKYMELLGLTGVGDGDNVRPETFALSQNHPNPFNPSTRIGYSLPVDAHVLLRVFNVLGQEVVTIVDGEQPAGAYTREWNGLNTRGEQASSGVYFYRIDAWAESGTVFTSLRKMMLVK